MLGVVHKPGFSHKEGSHGSCSYVAYSLLEKTGIKRIITQIITIVKSVISEKYKVLWRMSSVDLNQLGREDESRILKNLN